MPIEHFKDCRKLTSAEIFRGGTWMKGKEKVFRLERPAQHVVASQLSAVLKFQVTAAHVKTIQKACDVFWKMPKGGSIATHAPLKLFLRQQRSLINSLRHLYQQCGETPPVDFDEIWHEVNEVNGAAANGEKEAAS